MSHHRHPLLLRATAGVLATTTLLQGCVARTIEWKTVIPSTLQEPTSYRGTVKGQLVDGNTVLYSSGVTVSDGAVWGEGVRYDTAQMAIDSVVRIPVGEVLGLSFFTDGHQAVGGSSGNLGAAAVGAGVIVLGLFAYMANVW